MARAARDGRAHLGPEILDGLQASLLVEQCADVRKGEACELPKCPVGCDPGAALTLLEADL
jgi:hypothetical protein